MIIASATQAVADVSVKAAQTAPALSGPSLLSSFFALFLVIGLVIAIAWLLRRVPGSSLRPMENFRVVSSLALGGKEKLVLVEINGEQMVLGVTAHQVNLVHQLSTPLAANVPAAVSFSDWLKKLQSKDA